MNYWSIIPGTVLKVRKPYARPSAASQPFPFVNLVVPAISLPHVLRQNLHPCPQMKMREYRQRRDET
jgi:hypothetical protein